MNTKIEFTTADIKKIYDQSVIYQCACPAQLCMAILQLKDVYKYQLNCGKKDTIDIQIHDHIAQSTEIAHEELVRCLRKILEIDGWDLEKLEISENARLKKLNNTATA